MTSARAAGKPSSDGVHTLIDDDVGLHREAESARRLGFRGKSAIHPGQIPIFNEVFAPTSEEVAWANQVLAAFEAAGGAATKLADGAFVDLAVAERAQQILKWQADLRSLPSASRASSSVETEGS